APDERAPRPARVDPGHGRDPRAGPHLPRRAVHRGDVPGHRRRLMTDRLERSTTTEGEMEMRDVRAGRSPRRARSEPGGTVISTALAVNSEAPPNDKERARWTRRRWAPSR